MDQGLMKHITQFCVKHKKVYKVMWNVYQGLKKGQNQFLIIQCQNL
jgi:hypothetical protein